MKDYLHDAVNECVGINVTADMMQMISDYLNHAIWRQLMISDYLNHGIRRQLMSSHVIAASAAL